MRWLGGALIAVAVLAAAPAIAQAPNPRTATEHVVKPGETLGGIAIRAGVPRVLIIEANGLKEPYLLRSGQKLIIPRRRIHTVKTGETSFSIAMDQGVPWSVIAAANGLDPKAEVKPGQVLTIPTLAAPSALPAKPAQPASVAIPANAPAAGPISAPTPAQPAVAAPATQQSPAAVTDTRAPAFAWPVKGDVRRSFAPRGGKTPFHDGIDVLAPEGTAVRASAAGKVIFAGEGPKEYGLTVIIHHGGRWTTTYGFLKQVTVKQDDEVKAGERVGLVGDSGLATQPQLHFEVRRNKVALDPAKYLPKR